MAALLADTSAWIEYLRGTGSDADRALTDALKSGQLVAVAGVIAAEVLAGARDDAHAADLSVLLAGCSALEPVYPQTYQHAAALYRRCRGSGRTVRGTVDCLVAALAIEHGVEVLGVDRDLATLRDVCGLRLWGDRR